FPSAATIHSDSLNCRVVERTFLSRWGLPGLPNKTTTKWNSNPLWLTPERFAETLPSVDRLQYTALHYFGPLRSKSHAIRLCPNCRAQSRVSVDELHSGVVLVHSGDPAGTAYHSSPPVGCSQQG